jgi:hypothetical protein
MSARMQYGMWERRVTRGPPIAMCSSGFSCRLPVTYVNHGQSPSSTFMALQATAILENNHYMHTFYKLLAPKTFFVPHSTRCNTQLGAPSGGLPVGGREEDVELLGGEHPLQLLLQVPLVLHMHPQRPCKGDRPPAHGQLLLLAPLGEVGHHLAAGGSRSARRGSRTAAARCGVHGVTWQPCCSCSVQHVSHIAAAGRCVAGLQQQVSACVAAVGLLQNGSL